MHFHRKEAHVPNEAQIGAPSETDQDQLHEWADETLKKDEQALQGKKVGAIMAVYLLGVFMGSVDMGIVSPARTVIQGFFGIDASLGIWLITIYSLAYAAAIPVMGKLADKHGRKPIFLLSILLFGLGSLGCGLSMYTGSFIFLLAMRALQAVGGGGILPIANAEFGTSFPADKRGMALGLVGMVYGVANVVGSAVGSAIIDLLGQANWAFIFYFNVPIAAIIILMDLKSLPNHAAEEVKKTDLAGSLAFVVIILCVLYGIKNIDFFDFAASVASMNVWPFLLAGIVLWPLFVAIEHRAEDPILNLSHFHNPNICMTLIMSIASGIIMMGMLFVPQFSENVLGMPSGSGGYFTLIIGFASAIGAPASGGMIDKMGAKPVLGIGFCFSILGCLFLAFVTANFPNVVTIVVGLILAGIGMGFVMGTPLNYMMLEHTEKHEANSALATLSLVRSIGTIVAPALLAGFLAQAGSVFQSQAMDFMPTSIDFSNDPYVEAVAEDLDAMTGNPMTAGMAEGMERSGISLTEPMEMDMTGTDGENASIPQQALDRLQNADVTTIVDDCCFMAECMFDQMADSMKGNVESQITGALDQMKAAQASMPAMAGASMDPVIDDMESLNENLDHVFATALQNYQQEIRNSASSLQERFRTTLNQAFKKIYLCVGICAAVGGLLLVFYRSPARKKQ